MTKRKPRRQGSCPKGSTIPAHGSVSSAPPGMAEIRERADSVLPAEYAPPGVVINRNFDVVHAPGCTEPFLQPLQSTADANGNEQLQRANQEVESVNRELEQRVTKRTKALAAAHAELRANHERLKQDAVQLARLAAIVDNKAALDEHSIVAVTNARGDIIGEGAAFFVSLPATAEHALIPDTMQEPVILIAEDDEGHASLVKENLRRSGLSNRVELFRDGQEILDFLFGHDVGRRLNEGNTYLLLLGIRMPKVDGIEVLRQIKADPDLRRLPVMILTMTDDPREVERCHEFGCSVYLQKPVKDINFVEVRRVLAQIEQQHRLEAAEESLRESEARMKLAQQAGRIGIFDTDALKWNRSVWTVEQEAIYGLVPGTFGGASEAWAARVHPEDLPRVQQELARCVREQVRENEIEFRIVRPDGEIRWVTNRGLMTYDVSGRLLRIIGTSIDVTERKQAEASLKESEERFATFMSNTPAAAYIKDEAGRYVYFNHFVASLMGRSLEEMRGKTDEEWVPAGVAQQFRANDQEVLDTQKALHRVEVVPLPNQAPTYWLACKFPLSDSQGRRFVGGVSVDVTAAKRMEEEMVAVAEREQQRIGHDLHDGLGQQLTALEMKCFLLMEHLAAKDFAAKREQLQEQTRWISEALRECIALTRSLARGLAPVNLKAEGLMDALNGLILRTRVPGKVECCFNCPSPVALENPQAARHLYRIAQEAVNNALKHARSRRITLKLSQSNGALQLQIKDDGQGLPQNHEVNGGMGLEVMRHRAHIIGASLEIDSKAGKGVTVTCTLPLEEHERQKN